MGLETGEQTEVCARKVETQNWVNKKSGEYDTCTRMNLIVMFNAFL